MLLVVTWFYGTTNKFTFAFRLPIWPSFRTCGIASHVRNTLAMRIEVLPLSNQYAFALAR